MGAAGDDLGALDHTNTIPGSSSRAASMGVALPVQHAIGRCCCPLASLEIRGSDGHIATSHSVVDAKVDHRVEARVGARMEDMMDGRSGY
ncbi:hypothetical protein H5410_046979 [Solanum commersonii]|uniref:Uncharacterized protein n=1 Tax=Solanum commersonii TaxID=4109 RepID=A0A9J5XDR1_SOLCO|nr:hypothetical protein H5410_046979 [Solanum commersonii]